MALKRSIIAVLALSWTASEAGAQAARPWTEPDGAFTVTIPDGWAEVSYSEAPAGTLLIIGSASMRQSPDDYFRECFIHHKPMPNAPSTQAELNARGAEATPQDVFRGRPVESFKKETRSGVLVTNGIWTERGVWEMARSSRSRRAMGRFYRHWLAAPWAETKPARTLSPCLCFLSRSRSILEARERRH